MCIKMYFSYFFKNNVSVNIDVSEINERLKILNIDVLLVFSVARTQRKINQRSYYFQRFILRSSHRSFLYLWIQPSFPSRSALLESFCEPEPEAEPVQKEVSVIRNTALVTEAGK